MTESNRTLDCVLADLRERFDVVLDAIERKEGWGTNRVAPGKLILGELGDIEARGFIDVAALSERMGVEVAGRVLAEIDTYEADQHGSEDGVASQLARQLAEPRPADASTSRELHHWRRLAHAVRREPRGGTVRRLETVLQSSRP